MQEKSAFQVGCCQKSITPAYSVPLSGYGNTSFRMSAEVMDPIYTKAMAFRCADHTALIVENDLSSSVKFITDEARQQISERSGIPEDNIMIACIHLHSAPDQWNLDEPSIQRYNRELVDAIVENALDAVADMSPATARMGFDVVENLNYIRHYVLADGHVRGPSFGLQYDSPKVAHTREPDKIMQVVAFAREGKEDVVMVNWQAHPQIATINHYNSITADTVGVMRNYVEKKFGCKVFYVLGASGNVQAISLIKGETRYEDHISYGEAFGKAVEKILLSEMKPLNLNEVKTTKKVFLATIDKADASKLKMAEAVFAQWSKDNDYKAAVKAGEPWGINSPYHAKAIIQRSELPENEELALYAFSFGQLAFVFAPYEMFCENGSFVKENSPFACTFVSTLANRAMSYIASKQGFDYNCYEANTCRYVRGTAEELAECFVEMLGQLK